MLIFCALHGHQSRELYASKQGLFKKKKCTCVQYKYKGKPFKIILTVYPMKPRPVRVCCKSIGPRFHPAL